MPRLNARSIVGIMAAGSAAVLFATSVVAAQGSRSSLDVQRERAEAAFGARLAALSAARAETDVQRERYAAACEGKVTKARLRTPRGGPLSGTLTGRGAVVELGPRPQSPVMPDRVETQNETTPMCRALRRDIAAAAAQLPAERARIDEEARRRGIYPGIMRDLLASYGLEP